MQVARTSQKYDAGHIVTCYFIFIDIDCERYVITKKNKKIPEAIPVLKVDDEEDESTDANNQTEPDLDEEQAV